MSIFIEILNMSISAGCAALIVALIRLFIRKAPKKYSYMLWAVVFFHFMFPFAIQLPVSAVPSVPQLMPQSIFTSEPEPARSGASPIDNGVDGAVGDALIPASRINEASPIQIALGIGTSVWLAGVIALLLYAAIGYLRLKKKVSTAILVGGNLYETDLIKTPFVLGLIHPKIFIPIVLMC